MTIAEWLQELEERAALHNLTKPNKVMYAKLAMPRQKMSFTRCYTYDIMGRIQTTCH